MKRVCVTSFANSLLSNSYLLYKIKLININMIKIFLQNLSASKFTESNFTNHRERGIGDLLLNKFIGMNFSLSLSLSFVQQ